MDPNWSSRAVIIHRDEANSYGLTVFGNAPVSVQTIKKGGASEMAGIREGDIIIKVNGAVVENLNHTEVVNMIKNAGPYVTLTVRTPPDMSSMPVSGSSGRPIYSSQDPRTVTAPLPVDRGVQLQMQDNKFRTLQVYRDQAAQEYEALRKKHESSKSPRDKRELEKAEKSLRSIEQQMRKFRQSSPNVQFHSPTPFNPYPQSHHSVPFQPYPHPPLRLRNPLIQSWDNEDSSPPPPLPPRSLSTSLSFNDSENSTYTLGQLPEYSEYETQHYNHQGSNNSSTHVTNSHSFLYSPTSANYRPPFNKSSSGGGMKSHFQNQNNQQHHRAKSSPDPISMQKALISAAEGSKRCDSVNDLNNSNSGSVDFSKLGPCDSPPPPYGNYTFANDPGFINIAHLSSPPRDYLQDQLDSSTPFSPGDIISMEEDDGLIFSDSPNLSSSISGSSNPWSSLPRLLDHNAHLAVFMNFVIDNKIDPSSLLFYIITSLKVEEGTIKEIKRWGYEIHSTFTAPGSPLHVNHVDENIATEIDDSLVREQDKEEIMKRVFRKARNKAKEEINKQLEEFCKKKTAGLGTMFGPPDSQLEECILDKTKESKIIESYLLPRLENFCEEYKTNKDDRTLATINAVSTILQKQFQVRINNSPSISVLERCGSFVSKEKSVKAKFMKHSKKISHNGHHFSPQYIYSYKTCNICCKILWGVGPQGLQCSDCNIYAHRNCYSELADTCVGTEPDGLKKKDRLRQIKDKIRSKPDVPNPKRKSGIQVGKRNPDDNFSSNHSSSFGDADSSERPLQNSGKSKGSLKGDQRPDTLNEEKVSTEGFSHENDITNRSNTEARRSSNAVGRSESCKERPQRKQPREKRKHSDPNLTSKSSDVDLDAHRVLSDNSSASNSSLSARSSDSPSTSLELVAPPSSSSSLIPRPHETSDGLSSSGHSGIIEPYKFSTCWDGDSDIELEHDPPDWTKNVPDTVLSQLTPQEKKRQEILNELFHTERSHVRNLKVVDRLFHRPIKTLQLLPPDLVQMLFSSWDEMLEIHSKFNSALKKKRKENPVIGNIGPLLLEIFDGEMSESFKRAAASCCSRQQIGLKALKERREKNNRLNAFLVEAESEGVCRRLQIQDMIPMAMQRLTKYPLIFSKLASSSNSSTNLEENNEGERRAIEVALATSKEILNSVNHAKKEAEDNQRLIEIQGRLDRSSLEKGILSLEKGIDKPDVNFINELRNLDLTTHKLVHDGSLFWRMKSSKQKSEVLQEVQLVLLHDMVVILMKQEERFVLKIHTSSSYTGKAEKVTLRPVIKLNNLIIRGNAADKKAFMLINMTSSNMYDLVCSTMEERKQWLQHITKAADDYKSKQESRRSDLQPPSSTPIPDLDEKKDTDFADSGDSISEADPSSSQDVISSSSANNMIKDHSPAPPDSQFSESESGLSGSGKVGGSASNEQNISPSPSRKIGEFLRVSETSPLIDPSEVIVTSRDVQFAQPVFSTHEEIKRIDKSITKALENKMGLVSQMLHIPTESISIDSIAGPDVLNGKNPKELIAACIKQVDKLRINNSTLSESPDTIKVIKENSGIANTLSILLNKLLEVSDRKDEEYEARRQELHRIREQNHGYHERFQHNTKNQSPDSKSLISPTNSFPSSSIDQLDNDDVGMKSHSKVQFSATSSCNSSCNELKSSPELTVVEEHPSSCSYNQCSDIACNLTEEFTDALEEILSSDSDSVEDKTACSESDDFKASTLTLVPEKEGDYVNIEIVHALKNGLSSSSSSSISNDYENVIVDRKKDNKT